MTLRLTPSRIQSNRLTCMASLLGVLAFRPRCWAAENSGSSNLRPGRESASHRGGHSHLRHGPRYKDPALRRQRFALVPLALSVLFSAALVLAQRADFASPCARGPGGVPAPTINRLRLP